MDPVWSWDTCGLCAGASQRIGLELSDKCGLCFRCLFCKWFHTLNLSFRLHIFISFIKSLPQPSPQPCIHPPPALPRISFEPRPQVSPQDAFPKEKRPGDEVGLVFYAAGAATSSSFTKDWTKFKKISVSSWSFLVLINIEEVRRLVRLTEEEVFCHTQCHSEIVK